jgi:hypothetical protein
MADDNYEDAMNLLDLLALTTGSTPEEMEQNIGRVIRFKYPGPTDGTLRRDFSFTIRGTQLNYAGKISYRVYYNGYNDTFGSVARPQDIVFVDDPGHPKNCTECARELVQNALGFFVCGNPSCFTHDTRVTSS